MSLWVGHNILAYDGIYINALIDRECIRLAACIDTLVVSRLVNYSNEGGHSLAEWGERLGFRKGNFSDFSKFSVEMLDYCIQDTLVTLKVYEELKKYIDSPLWKQALRLEHDVSIICTQMHNNGFHFNLDAAKELHTKISLRLEDLNREMEVSFPPKAVLVREVTPKLTKFNTLSKVGLNGETDLSVYTAGAPFSKIKWVPFNPGSAKQRVERLNEAGWQPYEKTDGHKETEALIRNMKRGMRGFSKSSSKPSSSKGLNLIELEKKLEHFSIYGWTTSEDNLATLPPNAPDAARKLVQWLVLDRRRSVLEEWFSAVSGPDKPFKDLYTGDLSYETRIHPTINPIGAWTQRKSHQRPNCANIPTFHGLPRTREPTAVELIKSEIDPLLRTFWDTTPDRLIIGVDAESIQLRVLAHYMNDPQFTFAVTQGNKKDGSDPHSMNRKALGENICQSRDDAKTFIYAWLLGASVPKVAAILHCSIDEARVACENFLDFYPGLQYLKQVQIPDDAARGYFEGFDGRFVSCNSQHLMLAGYLQAGESIIMKKAQVLWTKKLTSEGVPFWSINDVHDEWQTETVNDMDVAVYIAETQALAIKEAGEAFNLRCPMAGSFRNDAGDYTIGSNWGLTH